MRKFLRSFGFLIVPGLILGAVVWMLIPNGVTFRFRFNTTVDAIPGSVFQFLFGFSSGGHEIVQINPVGVFMLLLILIAFAIPLVSKTLRHPYAWQGFLLSVSSVLMIVFPFLSLISQYYLQRIETAEAFDIPITITYALGVFLILAALFLLGAGIIAFILDREKISFRRAWTDLTFKKRKKTSHKQTTADITQKNHAK